MAPIAMPRRPVYQACHSERPVSAPLARMRFLHLSPFKYLFRAARFLIDPFIQLSQNRPVNSRSKEPAIDAYASVAHLLGDNQAMVIRR